MIVVTSVEAQSCFGELIDRAQREPIEITRRGRLLHRDQEQHCPSARKPVGANSFAFGV
jgi:hypothetical protein